MRIAWKKINATRHRISEYEAMVIRQSEDAMDYFLGLMCE
jgi:hypothetical protein